MDAPVQLFGPEAGHRPSGRHGRQGLDAGPAGDLVLALPADRAEAAPVRRHLFRRGRAVLSRSGGGAGHLSGLLRPSRVAPGGQLRPGTGVLQRGSGGRSHRHRPGGGAGEHPTEHWKAHDAQLPGAAAPLPAGSGVSMLPDLDGSRGDPGQPHCPTGGHSLPAAAGADAGKPAALPPLAAAGRGRRRGGAAPAGPAECPGTWHSGVDVVRTPDCRLVCLHKPVHWDGHTDHRDGIVLRTGLFSGQRRPEGSPTAAVPSLGQPPGNRRNLHRHVCGRDNRSVRPHDTQCRFRLVGGPSAGGDLHRPRHDLVRLRRSHPPAGGGPGRYRL